MDPLTFLDILSELGRVAALVLLIALTVVAVKNMPTSDEDIRACFHGDSRSEAEKRWLR